MHCKPYAIAAIACIALIALSGCAGNNLPAPAAQRKPLPKNAVFNIHVNGRPATLALGSPGLISGDIIHVGKDCDKRGRAPNLTWGEVPSGTAELALFVLRISSSSSSGISLEWAAAGMNPFLRNVGAGQLPAGAILGSEAHGGKPFRACPKPGTTARYLFLLYSLPTRHRLRAGFNATKLFVPTYNSTTPFGAFVLNYARS